MGLPLPKNPEKCRGYSTRKSIDNGINRVDISYGYTTWARHRGAEVLDGVVSMAENRQNGDETQSCLVLAQGTMVGHYQIIEKDNSIEMSGMYIG